MRRFAFFAVGGLVLAGCASPIESMMLTADTALISSVGNNPGDKAKVVEASLKEAAKVTSEHGYRYFVIMDAADASQLGRRIRVSSRLRQERVGENPYGTSNLPSSTSIYGTYPPAGQSVTYLKPGLDITIRMFREGEIDPAMRGVLNSEAVLTSVAPAAP